MTKLRKAVLLAFNEWNTQSKNFNEAMLRDETSINPKKKQRMKPTNMASHL